MVFMAGSRQAGKTTLARMIAERHANRVVLQLGRRARLGAAPPRALFLRGGRAARPVPAHRRPRRDLQVPRLEELSQGRLRPLPPGLRLPRHRERPAGCCTGRAETPSRAGTRCSISGRSPSRSWPAARSRWNSSGAIRWRRPWMVITPRADLAAACRVLWLSGTVRPRRGEALPPMVKRLPQSAHSRRHSGSDRHRFDWHGGDALLAASRAGWQPAVGHEPRGGSEGRLQHGPDVAGRPGALLPCVHDCHVDPPGRPSHAEGEETVPAGLRGHRRLRGAFREHGRRGAAAGRHHVERSGATARSACTSSATRRSRRPTSC